MSILSRIFSAKIWDLIKFTSEIGKKWRRCLGRLHIYYIDFESKLSGHTNIRLYFEVDRKNVERYYWQENQSNLDRKV